MSETERKDEFLQHYMMAHDRLGRYIRSMVWEREDARDLVSETILVAFENFHKLRSKEAFVYYLFGIAARLMKKRGRYQQRYHTMGDEGWEKLGDSLGNSDSNSADDLYRMLATLPAKYRESLVLFEISGFSIKEIADIQGGTLSGVKSRLVRARAMLAEIAAKETAQIK